MIATIAGGGATALTGCGTMRTHWGVSNDYVYDFDDGYYYHDNGNHYGHYKKHKKHKKYKYKKRHRHHDHDDDD